MKEAAGILLYRDREGLEVLLVHPSGSYNAHSPWSVPKGELDEGEDARCAAIRELDEETGVKPPPELFPLGEVIYKNNRKRVVCFAGKADDQEPSCASWEVDRAEFLTIEKAMEVINPAQKPFLDRLIQHLK